MKKRRKNLEVKHIIVNNLNLLDGRRCGYGPSGCDIQALDGELVGSGRHWQGLPIHPDGPGFSNG